MASGLVRSSASGPAPAAAAPTFPSISSTFVWARYPGARAGPKTYSGVVLPDADVIAELEARGQLFRTDVDDAACAANAAKIGPDADGQPGGCDNVRGAPWRYAACAGVGVSGG